MDPLSAVTAAKIQLLLVADLRAGAVQRDDTEIGMTVRWWKLSEAVDAVRAGRITEAGSVAGLLLAAHAQGVRPDGHRDLLLTDDNLQAITAPASASAASAVHTTPVACEFKRSWGSRLGCDGDNRPTLLAANLRR
ncbi:hypothetical protein [Streptomyces platensis]|uniref:hypothetical protein n=1 Tax=Streptomyces platensis TaxID=58346 RepID=UPI002E15A302|nr:hypothetical protein OG229_03155 [Streptomyces platensis]WUB78193.1 hypothetical protein OG424_02705 [Streptomyces platensis]